MIFAASVFGSTRLVSNIGDVVHLYALGAGVYGIIVAKFSKLPMLGIAPETIPVAFFIPMLHILEAEISDDRSLFQTMKFVIMISYFIVSIFIIFAEQLYILRLIQFIPFPVACGLLSGIGVLMVKAVIRLVSVLLLLLLLSKKMNLN